MLSPDEYRELQQRVEIEFSEENREYFAADDLVKLKIEVKNVPKLMVRIYRINAASYYQQTQQHVRTDINLDGLVANEEQTLSFNLPPIQRTERVVELSMLRRPGIYVVDFVGSGKSSRALIQKGRLHHIQRITASGHLFHVLDEQNHPLLDATIWMAGRTYRPNEKGEILQQGGAADSPRAAA